MSRGPGVWQRAILDTLDEVEAVCVTHPDYSTGEQVAIRRAAYTLKAQGRILLTSERIDGRPRLVAHRPDANRPSPQTVTGGHGKKYRQPHWERPQRR